MTIDQLGSIGEFSTAILLFVSLIYVGLQIKQNTNATRAQIYQSRTDSLERMAFFIAGSQEIAEIMVKVETGQADLAELTPVELRRFTSIQFVNSVRLDNFFYQYEHGFLDDEFYEDRVTRIVTNLAPVWDKLGLNSGRASFRREIDRILAGAD